MEADWEAHLARHALAEPIGGAVSAKMTLLYGLPEGREQFEPKTTKPDVDNVEKTMYDVMASLGFFTSTSRKSGPSTTCWKPSANTPRIRPRSRRQNASTTC